MIVAVIVAGFQIVLELDILLTRTSACEPHSTLNELTNYEANCGS